MAQTRLGVSAPWRVEYILALECTENNCLPNHAFRNVKCAETLGFMAAVYEGFSEPPDLRMVDRGYAGFLISSVSGTSNAQRTRCDSWVPSPGPGL